MVNQSSYKIQILKYEMLRAGLRCTCTEVYIVSNDFILCRWIAGTGGCFTRDTAWLHGFALRCHAAASTFVLSGACWNRNHYATAATQQGWINVSLTITTWNKHITINAEYDAIGKALIRNWFRCFPFFRRRPQQICVATIFILRHNLQFPGL